jgi:CDGSH-type Zn-finger protein
MDVSRDAAGGAEAAGPRGESPAPEGVVIKVRKNGPYKVTGPVTVIDADGNEFELPEGDGIVLCRCGGSKTKPFCDKTHSKIGFEAAERAVRETG